MMTRILLPVLAFILLTPRLTWALAEPPQPPLPDLPPELKAEVEALKKPIHKYTAYCYSRPMDRSDSALPSDCDKLEVKLRETLKAANPAAVLHAIFRHGVLYLVRATDAYPDDRAWQGRFEANARVLSSYIVGADAHTVVQYAIHAMRVAQKDDTGDVEYSSALSRVTWLAWMVAGAAQTPYPSFKGPNKINSIQPQPAASEQWCSSTRRENHAPAG